VSNVHEVHASAGWPKQGLRVLAAMPSVGEIGSVDLCGCRFVKEKSVAQIVDEHGLDEGLSKPRQGDRLTRIGAIAKFGSVGRGSLHAYANSAAQELAACPQMRIRQRAANGASQGLDLARSKTWAKDCPRHGLKSSRRWDAPAKAHCLEFGSDGLRQPCIGRDEFGRQHAMVYASL